MRPSPPLPQSILLGPGAYTDSKGGDPNDTRGDGTVFAAAAEQRRGRAHGRAQAHDEGTGAGGRDELHPHGGDLPDPLPLPLGTAAGEDAGGHTAIEGMNVTPV